MKKQKALKRIGQILAQLAAADLLPMDMTGFDVTYLEPAFYNGSQRYLTVDVADGRCVWDTQEEKYITLPKN